MNKVSIKELRLRHGLTQMQFSQAMGLSINAVNRWETGKAKISDLNRYRAATYFGVDPDTIKGGVNEL